MTCYDAIYTDNNTNVLCLVGLTVSCSNLTIQVARYKLVLICETPKAQTISSVKEEMKKKVMSGEYTVGQHIAPRKVSYFRL